MRTNISILALVLMAALHTANSQSGAPSIPVLTLTNNRVGWDRSLLPDGRMWLPRPLASEGTTVSIPIYVRNCWRPSGDVATFPIRSFTIPVQVDDRYWRVVGIDTTGFADNFSYTWRVDADSTYLSVVDAPVAVRSNGVRITVQASARTGTDSLRPSAGASANCERAPFRRMFSLLLALREGVATDTALRRTAIVLAHDSLRYEGRLASDPIWISNGEPRPGLGGIDNYFTDIGGGLSCRDTLRPSRVGMLWVEISDKVSSIAADTDTARITIPSDHQWSDTLTGRGMVDVIISNTVLGTRATGIDITTSDPWLHIRSVPSGPQDPYATFPRPVRSATLSSLDHGTLDAPGAISPYGELMSAQPPLQLRLYGNNPMEADEGTFVGNVTFASSTMQPSPFVLPVVLTITRTLTSVADDPSSPGSSSLLIAPNPSTGMVTITTNAGPSSTITIMSTDGRIVERVDVRGDTASASTAFVTSLAPGVYTAIMRSPSGVAARRFVVLR